MQNFADYFALFEPQQQQILQEMRQIISEVLPGAKECISYQMPTYKLGRNLVHFALCKNHMGFYPTPSAIRAFAAELEGYGTSKGAVQFPLSQELPKALIQKMCLFRLNEEMQRVKK